MKTIATDGRIQMCGNFIKIIENESGWNSRFIVHDCSEKPRHSFQLFDEKQVDAFDILNLWKPKVFTVADYKTKLFLCSFLLKICSRNSFLCLIKEFEEGKEKWYGNDVASQFRSPVFNKIELRRYTKLAIHRSIQTAGIWHILRMFL